MVATCEIPLCVHALSNGGTEEQLHPVIRARELPNSPEGGMVQMWNFRATLCRRTLEASPRAIRNSSPGATSHFSASVLSIHEYMSVNSGTCPFRQIAKCSLKLVAFCSQTEGLTLLNSIHCTYGSCKCITQCNNSGDGSYLDSLLGNQDITSLITQLQHDNL